MRKEVEDRAAALLHRGSDSDFDAVAIAEAVVGRCNLRPLRSCVVKADDGRYDATRARCGSMEGEDPRDLDWVPE